MWTSMTWPFSPLNGAGLNRESLPYSRGVKVTHDSEVTRLSGEIVYTH